MLRAWLLCKASAPLLSTHPWYQVESWEDHKRPRNQLLICMWHILFSIAPLVSSHVSE